MARRKQPAAPPVAKQYVRLEVNERLLTTLPDGAIVMISGRVARIAWKWMFRDQPVATEVRYARSLVEDPVRWDEPTEVHGDTMAELLEAPMMAGDAPAVNHDPLMGAIGDQPLLDQKPS